MLQLRGLKYMLHYFAPKFVCGADHVTQHYQHYLCLLYKHSHPPTVPEGTAQVVFSARNNLLCTYGRSPTYVYTRESSRNTNSGTLEPDRPQRDPPVASDIAQQYTSATFVMLRCNSRKVKLGAILKN